MFAQMKRGTYVINCARGKLVERDVVVRALNSGHIAGYAGDVWFPEPTPPDHRLRTMPFNGMTPHISASTLSAQARYAAAGTLEILQSYFEGTPIREEYLIVEGGALAGTGAKSYKLT
jgi:formate dehydrogenase